MIVRTKSGEFRADTMDVLLEFLGVKREAAGRVKVSGDVEVITGVPIISEQRTGNSEQRHVWDCLINKL